MNTMGNLLFGSGSELGRASIARGRVTESPMGRDNDIAEAEKASQFIEIFADWLIVHSNGIDGVGKTAEKSSIFSLIRMR